MEATELEWKEIEDEEKKKIKNFEGEVIVLIPTPPTSNLYILNILARISEVIHLIKNNNKYRDERKKIQAQYHFLMLIDSMRDVEYTREPLEKHYRYIIKDVNENIDTLAQIRYHEFQSLANNFIMSLERLSDKEHREIISKSGYFDIRKYIEDYVKKGGGGVLLEDIAATSLIGLRRSEVNNIKDKKEKIAFDTFFTPYKGEGEHRYAMSDLLRSLLMWKEKNKILVVMDTTRDIIKRVMEDLKMERVLEKVAIAAYPNPLEVFGTESPPPSFSNLLSKHINEVTTFKYEEKKKFFYSMLNKINSRVFSTGGEEEKTLTEKEIKEIINEGFLTVQKSIIQQLSTII